MAPSASAQTPDVYADSVYQASNQVYLPTNAVGAPDQDRAEFIDLNANLILDMGEGEEGTGDLTLHFQLVQFGAMYNVEFLDEAFLRLHQSGSTFPLNTNQLTVPYPLAQSYRYIKITNLDTEVWKLDAIAAQGYATGEVPPAPEVTPEPEQPAVPTRGMIVKLVDDGDPTTTYDAAVYVIGGDSKRHAFPSESVFFSWFPNYSNLAFIDPENLASYPLGGNVTVRAGTHLVKLQTDPKVYALEPGSVLRWVTTETIAASLYGSDWAKRVVDVSDVFFGNYTVGEPLTAAVHPTGTFGFLPSGEVVYIRNGVYYHTGSVFTATGFDSTFLIAISQGIADLYVDGGELAFDPEIAYPY